MLDGTKTSDGLQGEGHQDDRAAARAGGGHRGGRRDLSRLGAHNRVEAVARAGGAHVQAVQLAGGGVLVGFR
jgi:hypothetical protein